MIRLVLGQPAKAAFLFSCRVSALLCPAKLRLGSWKHVRRSAIQHQLICMGRNWDHFTISRDQSGRIYIARCVLCGQLIAATPDRLKTFQLAANHDCRLNDSDGSA